MTIANNRKKVRVSETNNWKMNNIERTNIVILKQSTVEKVNNNYKSYIYSIIAAI